MNRRRLILLAGGVLLLLVALFSIFDVNVPSRPTGSADELAELRSRVRPRAGRAAWAQPCLTPGFPSGNC